MQRGGRHHVAVPRKCLVDIKMGEVPHGVGDLGHHRDVVKDLHIGHAPSPHVYDVHRGARTPHSARGECRRHCVDAVAFIEGVTLDQSSGKAIGGDAFRVEGILRDVDPLAVPRCGPAKQRTWVDHTSAAAKVRAWRRNVLHKIPEGLNGDAPVLIVPMAKSALGHCVYVGTMAGIVSEGFGTAIDETRTVWVLPHEAFELSYQVGNPNLVYSYLSALRDTLHLARVLRKRLRILLLQPCEVRFAFARCILEKCPHLRRSEPTVNPLSRKSAILHTRVIKRSRCDFEKRGCATAMSCGDNDSEETHNYLHGDEIA
mmetsp:Transcript_55466/g.121823  ORF Transcript_55466/g.121823 Transcript_55466/m.121823 type:complete len:315 (-) Transcript_55466:8-952(-)